MRSLLQTVVARVSVRGTFEEEYENPKHLVDLDAVLVDFFEELQKGVWGEYIVGAFYLAK